MPGTSRVELGGNLLASTLFLTMAFQGDSIYWVEVEKIVPNPFQPRREFDQKKLQELSDSIRMYGVLQPLTVTRKEVQREDGTFYSEYELIAGERRLRASKLAGVAQVPVIIREGEESEQEKLELAIIENLQREDLNAIDRAIAFKQLSEEFGLSHSQVAKKVGRSREYVSNSVRLLALPEHIQLALKRGDISEGHARTLLMLSDRPEEQEVIFREIVLKKLSVRESERIIRKIATDRVRKKNPNEFDTGLIEFEKRFTEKLGTRVQIQKTDFGGKLTIDYFSEDDLAVLLNRIKAESATAAPTVSDIASHLSTHTPLMMESEQDVSTDEGAFKSFMAAAESVPEAQESGNEEEVLSQSKVPERDVQPVPGADQYHSHNVLAELSVRDEQVVSDEAAVMPDSHVDAEVGIKPPVAPVTPTPVLPESEPAVSPQSGAVQQIGEPSRPHYLAAARSQIASELSALIDQEIAVPSEQARHQSEVPSELSPWRSEVPEVKVESYASSIQSPEPAAESETEDVSVPSEPTPAESDGDDSDLYSIKSFSV
jgi:ParB family chromosome partitioning protein